VLSPGISAGTPQSSTSREPASISVIGLAEGIESMETREMLEQLGCTLAQGYEFGSPMSAARLGAFVRSLREVDYLMLTA